MDKVERAVIELDGLWLNDFRRILVVYKSGKEYRCFDSVPDACWDFVCTYDEFMETRKRLENKPAWYEHEYDFVAQCRDGLWVGFYDGVTIEAANHIWYQGIYGGHTIQQGHVFGDWRQSLERRPDHIAEPSKKVGIDWSKAPEDATHGGVARGGRICWYKDVDSHKYCYVYQGESEWSVGAGGSPSHQPLERRPEEKRVIVCECCQGAGTIDETLGGEAFSNPEAECPDCDGAGEIEIGETSSPEPQWVQGELPPVGSKCEVDIGSKNWVECEILAHTESPLESGEIVVVFKTEGKIDWYVKKFFRPTQSHRDKVIEAAREFFTELGFCPNDGQLGKAFDAGLLKLPEGE